MALNKGNAVKPQPASPEAQRWKNTMLRDQINDKYMKSLSLTEVCAGKREETGVRLRPSK